MQQMASILPLDHASSSPGTKRAIDPRHEVSHSRHRDGKPFKVYQGSMQHVSPGRGYFVTCVCWEELLICGVDATPSSKKRPATPRAGVASRNRFG